MKLNKINSFEKLNNISINVYSLDDELNLYPLRISEETFDVCIHLLLIQEKEKRHYILMKDLSPFIKHDSKNKKYVCPRCLSTFNKQEKLDSHLNDCKAKKPTRVTFSDKEKLEFTNTERQIKHAFVIYADFESTLEKIQTCEANPMSSYTQQVQKHTANSFCVYTKCEQNEYSKLETYVGPNASEEFFKYLRLETQRIYDLQTKNCPMYLSDKVFATYKKAQRCYICDKPFTEKDFKVKDHNHLSGKYRGPAHRSCNLKIRYPNYIPVFMHNLSNYDAHLFVRELSKCPGKLNVIPETAEKYIFISKSLKVGEYFNKKLEKTMPINRELRFLDSFRFLPSSLDKLASNLTSDKLHNLRNCYPEENEFKLLQNKGLYPYDYIDDETKLSSEQIPTKLDFYNKLKDEHISDENYDHFKHVWKVFKCKKFKDYHELYLKVDTLLLADIFENFRNTCMNTYQLDPVHYFTAPGLSFDSLLKYTKIKLDYIKDVDIQLFIEKGIRGGISTIVHRYAKANNKDSIDYDESKDLSYISYLDANNLYGWAMSQSLPTGNFRWLSTTEVNRFDIFRIENDYKKGYVMEVDLEYPEELHDLHNDLPLAPESLKVNKVPKLIPNLRDKKKYVVHYRNLKQYLQLGLILKKIHRILEFEQSPWMKPYIDLNTEKRKQAQDEFSKDFYKLMNNSVFGKTMENIRERVDIKLVQTKAELLNLTSKPTLKTITRFSDNLIACHMKRVRLKFDKPIYIGMAVLDISKTLMYDFHYNTIKHKYQDKAQLLFTDTDSLCYHINTDDLNSDRREDLEKYDTSNYPKDHSLYSSKFKKEIGKFKDETGGIPITEFVGLRAKLYCYKTTLDEIKKAKGVSKHVIKKDLTMEEYKSSLFNHETIHKKMYTIQSTKHELYTNKINKIALSGDDDKRIILQDRIHTLAIGHYKS